MIGVKSPPWYTVSPWGTALVTVVMSIIYICTYIPICADTLHTHARTCTHAHTPLCPWFPATRRKTISLCEMKTGNHWSFGCLGFFFSLLASLRLQTLRHRLFPLAAFLSHESEQCWTDFVPCGKQSLAEKLTQFPCKGRNRKGGAHTRLFRTPTICLNSSQGFLWVTGR